MAAQEKKVGKLIVKWDDDMPFGTPFVSVVRKGLVPVAVASFDDANDTQEQAIEKATTWAEQNQDKANDGLGGLFG